MGLEDFSCLEAWMKAVACRVGSGYCTVWGFFFVVFGGDVVWI